LKPIRFTVSGAQWGPVGVNQREYLRNQAASYEQAGVDVMSFPDHLLNGMRPPLATLLSAAEATTKLRFGTMVLNNDFWHPVLLAREIATISALTNGRVELGIGAGHAKVEYDSLGMTFDEASIRVDRLGEALPLLRALMDGEKVTHAGAHYQLNDAEIGLVEPAPRVPILVGGNGKRLLRLAGKYADAVGFTGLARNIANGHLHQPDWSHDYLDSRLELVKEAAGSRFGDLEMQALVQEVGLTDDREEAATTYCALVRDLGLELDVPTVLNTPFLLFGTIEEMATAVLTARDRFGFTCFTLRSKPTKEDPSGLEVISALIAEVHKRS
jgi:probable F420-dependent oxidoreductase